jgi:hypothetical protein
MKKNEMVVGYEEAMMMINEGLIKKTGDSIVDFFGVPRMKVVGILRPTGTIIDSYHIVNSETFSIIQEGGEIIVLSAPDGNPKLFYPVAEKIPSKLTGTISPLSFKQVLLNGKQYMPVFVGYEEAQMMKKENLFAKDGDIIPDFFGNDVILGGVIPQTKTSIDMMHFVGSDFAFPQ